VELDLTIPFQELQSSLIPLTTSLPITLHNLKGINDIFTTYFAGLKDGEEHLHSGVDSALYLLQALYETCLGEAIPYLSTSTASILRVGSLRALDPKLVERAYSTLSLILRTLGSNLLKPDLPAQQALRETWTHLRPYLRPKHNKAYVRKCVSDAWIGVVRKARAEGLGRLMGIMLDDGVVEGMEAIWAGSLRGTTGQLHSRALPVLEILLDRLDDRADQQRMLSRVITALVHHCSATTITPVVQAIISRIPSSSPEDPGLASTNALQLLAVPLFTRKGKRFPEPLVKTAMSKLLSLLPSLRISSSEWKKAFVQCVIGCLMAGKLVHWLSPGVALVDGLWDALVSQAVCIETPT
jgi:U3 small nucleolar RNA-associated protein 20